jgi:hypothetical protein
MPPALGSQVAILPLPLFVALRSNIASRLRRSKRVLAVYTRFA